MNSFRNEFIVSPRKRHSGYRWWSSRIQERPLDKADATLVVDKIIILVVPLTLVRDGENRAIRISVHVVRSIADGKGVNQFRFDHRIVVRPRGGPEDGNHTWIWIVLARGEEDAFLGAHMNISVDIFTLDSKGQLRRLHGAIDVVNQGDLQSRVESELVDRWLNSESERPCKQHKHTISSS